MELNEELIEAVEKGDIEAVKQHLADSADVNAKNEDGMTPLHRAAHKGHKEIAELLIANGADVNAKEGVYAATPLYSATMNAKKEVVELLIAKGADVNAKDKNGETPVDLAFKAEMRDLLRKHGGKTGDELK